jgi:hypothetical protein
VFGAGEWGRATLTSSCGVAPDSEYAVCYDVLQWRGGG